MNNYINLIMQDSEIRKAVGTRIKQLRKQKSWTQKELAKCIEGSYQQLNKYESGIHTPPLDKLIQLSKALDTTIDYLITGQVAEDMPLHNQRLLERFKLLESFNVSDKETVINLIDAMIAKQRMEQAMSPIG
ncbi:MAG: helix-turn-helix transcriptional regulator [Sedimenticola sp.]